jgi:serine phosphatase RsbU (regulator of sigma subunit)
VEQDRWEKTCLFADARFIDAISRLTGESRVDYLPASLKQQFQADGFQFVIPIRSKDRLIGTLFLGEKQSEASYSSGELEFLSAAARQASVAIENAFLYEELAQTQRMALELQIARRIQLASLPQKTPVLPSFDIAGSSQPAMEVGGDFFDYLPGGEDRITVIVGDVSGKGTSAALYMSKVQGILRSLNEFDLTPAEMFIRTNRLLAADMARNSFVTAIGATFDGAKRTVLLARAGHLPLYVFRSSTVSVERLAPRGLGLALDENRKFVEQLEQTQISFAAGDTFLFVSDGVTEAHNEIGEEYGEIRVLELLRREGLPREGLRSAEEIRDTLLDDVSRFTGIKDHEDDCTVVVVKVRGS